MGGTVALGGGGTLDSHDDNGPCFSTSMIFYEEYLTNACDLLDPTTLAQHMENLSPHDCSLGTATYHSIPQKKWVRKFGHSIGELLPHSIVVQCFNGCFWFPQKVVGGI